MSMSYELTDDQFQMLLDYFLKSTTAVSDEEICALLDLDKPLLKMLQGIREEQA